MWPFNPSWKSGNPEKRKSAIEKLNPVKLSHQIILSKIVLNESEDSIWKCAIKKISDKLVLTNIAKSTYLGSISIAAIKRIADENLITEIAKSGKSFEGRQFAYQLLGKSSYPEALVDIALNDLFSDRRIKAVKKIDDQILLVHIAKNVMNDEIKTEALKKINDQHYLEEVALRDYDCKNRCLAIKGLENQKVLLNLATNDSNFDIRMAATIQLTDISTKIECLIELFRQSDAKIDFLHKSSDREELVPELLKLFNNNQLSQANKMKLIHLKGSTVNEHYDKHSDNGCAGDFHHDFPAVLLQF